MKYPEKNITPFIVLFWSLPSISSLQEYKEKCVMLNQAIDKVKSVEITTAKDAILKLTQIKQESGTYFGLEKMKGELRKIILNVKEIKSITLL